MKSGQRYPIGLISYPNPTGQAIRISRRMAHAA